MYILVSIRCFPKVNRREIQPGSNDSFAIEETCLRLPHSCISSHILGTRQSTLHISLSLVHNDSMSQVPTVSLCCNRLNRHKDYRTDASWRSNLVCHSSWRAHAHFHSATQTLTPPFSRGACIKTTQQHVLVKFPPIYISFITVIGTDISLLLQTILL